MAFGIAHVRHNSGRGSSAVRYIMSKWLSTNIQTDSSLVSQFESADIWSDCAGLLA